MEKARSRYLFFFLFFYFMFHTFETKDEICILYIDWRLVD